MKILVRVNVDTISGCSKGQVVELDADEDGTPLSYHWRRRLVDAKTDRCVDVLPSAKGRARAKAHSEAGE